MDNVALKMTEVVLRGLIQQDIRPIVQVQEALPSKGKPARKTVGSATVYTVKITVQGKESVLEASRGGPREWSDFNLLVKWFKSIGIRDYKATLFSPADLVQQSLDI